MVLLWKCLVDYVLDLFVIGYWCVVCDGFVVGCDDFVDDLLCGCGRVVVVVYVVV